MQTSLRGIANRAETHKEHRFRNLSGLLNEANLTLALPILAKGRCAWGR